MPINSLASHPKPASNPQHDRGIRDRALDSKYPLSIQPMPEPLQWWSEFRYWLIHDETGLRLPGSWTINEALHVQEVSRFWDWRVEPKSRIPRCQEKILALCERSESNQEKKRSSSSGESAFVVYED